MLQIFEIALDTDFPIVFLRMNSLFVQKNQ